jgi:hypothetical protein
MSSPLKNRKGEGVGQTRSWRAKPTPSKAIVGDIGVSPLITNTFIPEDVKMESPSLYPIRTKFRSTKFGVLKVTLLGRRVKDKRSLHYEVQFDSNYQRIANVYGFFTGMNPSKESLVETVEQHAKLLLVDHKVDNDRSFIIKDIKFRVHPASLLLFMMHAYLPKLTDQILEAVQTTGGLINFKTLCLVLVDALASGRVEDEDIVIRKVKLASEDETRDPIGIMSRAVFADDKEVIYIPFVGENRSSGCPTKLFTQTCAEMVVWKRESQPMIGCKMRDGELKVADTCLTRCVRFKSLLRVLDSERYTFLHHPESNFNHYIVACGSTKLKWYMDVSYESDVPYGLVCIFANILSTCHHLAKSGGDDYASHYLEIFGPFSTWTELLSKTSGKLRSFTEIVMTAGRLLAAPSSKMKYVPFGPQSTPLREERWQSIFQDAQEYIALYGDVGLKVLSSVASGVVPDESAILSDLPITIDGRGRLGALTVVVCNHVLDGRRRSWPEIVKAVIDAEQKSAMIQIDEYSSILFQHPYWSPEVYEMMKPVLCYEWQDELRSFDGYPVIEDPDFKGRKSIARELLEYSGIMLDLRQCELRLIEKGFLKPSEEFCRIGEAKKPGPGEKCDFKVKPYGWAKGIAESVTGNSPCPNCPNCSRRAYESIRKRIENTGTDKCIRFKWQGEVVSHHKSHCEVWGVASGYVPKGNVSTGPYVTRLDVSCSACARKFNLKDVDDISGKYSGKSNWMCHSCQKNRLKAINDFAEEFMHFGEAKKPGPKLHADFKGQIDILIDLDNVNTSLEKLKGSFNLIGFMGQGNGFKPPQNIEIIKARSSTRDASDVALFHYVFTTDQRSGQRGFVVLSKDVIFQNLEDYVYSAVYPSVESFLSSAIFVDRTQLRLILSKGEVTHEGVRLATVPKSFVLETPSGDEIARSDDVGRKLLHVLLGIR